VADDEIEIVEELPDEAEEDAEDEGRSDEMF